MSGAGFDLAPVVYHGLSLFGVCLTAAAVKLMDDMLDVDLDRLSGLMTWAGSQGVGSMPYALAFIAVAGTLVPHMALPLFAASYTIGMLHDGRRPLPLGLSGIEEGCLLLGTAAWAYGIKNTMGALAVILAIQCFDDWLDRDTDRLSGRMNLVHKWGMVETPLVASIALLIATGLSPAITVHAILAASLVMFVFTRLSNREVVAR